MIIVTAQNSKISPVYDCASVHIHVLFIWGKYEVQLTLDNRLALQVFDSRLTEITLRKRQEIARGIEEKG